MFVYYETHFKKFIILRILGQNYTIYFYNIFIKIYVYFMLGLSIQSSRKRLRILCTYIWYNIIDNLPRPLIPFLSFKNKTKNR
jgi:hypothetical protein